MSLWRSATAEIAVNAARPRGNRAVRETARQAFDAGEAADGLPTIAIDANQLRKGLQLPTSWPPPDLRHRRATRVGPCEAVVLACMIRSSPIRRSRILGTRDKSVGWSDRAGLNASASMASSGQIQSGGLIDTAPATIAAT